MPLTVHVPEKGDIYIGDLHFYVESVRDNGSAYTLVEHHNAMAPLRVDINHRADFYIGQHQVTIFSLPNMKCTTNREACLRIAADKSVTILRGDLYRKNGAQFIVSSLVREAVATGQVSVTSTPQLIELASNGRRDGNNIVNGKLVFVLDGPVIIGVAERP